MSLAINIILMTFSVGDQRHDFWTVAFPRLDLKFSPVNLSIITLTFFLPVSIPGLAKIRQEVFILHF